MANLKELDEGEDRLSSSRKELETSFIARMEFCARSVGSVSALAKAAGISQSGIRRYFTGGEPSRPQLIAIAKAAGVGVAWLAVGEEEEQQAGTDYPKDEPLETQEAGEQLPGVLEDYAFVPLYDAQCSAGGGAWNENCRVLTHLSFTRYSLRKQGLTPEHLSAIRVDGDSMEPVLHSGDTVLIDHTRTTIEGEGIYVIRLDDHLYAKRLQRHFDGLAIISENHAYERITVPRDRLEELEVIGRAVWAAGWL
ncbi:MULTISPECIES: XRE family transcriptional regulator [Halomonas]|uniref:Transcriptional regulator n=1 Tax=Halomonas halophila TaxID=29573 RepID=A0ABQ0TZ91_9GAMM|nr:MULTISPECIES: helix-turn-helix transcriptional regulator [Halomonas]MDR5889673.1 helix-turn-helix transcriptional regulator [Halomonas salina]WJY06355.1 helix-turn-helix transcriptional regulator [Halomonas halophila]GEK71558.1 transcriptional regulator [Halomonas halophila]